MNANETINSTKSFRRVRVCDVYGGASLGIFDANTEQPIGQSGELYSSDAADFQQVTFPYCDKNVWERIYQYCNEQKWIIVD